VIAVTVRPRREKRGPVLSAVLLAARRVATRKQHTGFHVARLAQGQELSGEDQFVVKDDRPSRLETGH
jgi:hypothetical protein